MPNEDVFIANVVAAWKNSLERADKLFSNLTDAELQARVAPDRNRLIYLWGHLTAIHDRMLALLGAGDRVHPDFDAIFLAAADGATELPPTAIIRDSWASVNKRVNEAIAGFSASQWLEKHTAVSDEDFAKEPLRNRLSILLSRTNHLSYHLGQALLVRR